MLSHEDAAVFSGEEIDIIFSGDEPIDNDEDDDYGATAPKSRAKKATKAKTAATTRKANAATIAAAATTSAKPPTATLGRGRAKKKTVVDSDETPETSEKPKATRGRRKPTPDPEGALADEVISPLIQVVIIVALPLADYCKTLVPNWQYLSTTPFQLNHSPLTTLVPSIIY
ncbi:hypothetical protein SYNPS1DRAFT_29200 [Syncephalis pseudoplumigaleata]|uniref:Uncharacterized protein n=1 Tax=Syncephalis pseudoplumigaleata TaxID=1712513 RepID=A0A4P9YY34_9FUNG|nr:hypothetical protein SYNPS1DRAFT_29200 [Syncephalis pseudoplumigaleata]|eukprot:RKP25053.1 hypothetical protein SYNPS1DRAFT_29200 [Syncephalis pseudoplumigaleata]